MKYVSLFFLLLAVKLSAQLHFNFETDTLIDGDSTDICTGGWCIQLPSNRWTISHEECISGNYSLHHNFDNENPGIDFFLLKHDHMEMKDSLSLSFRVKHSYPPSSSNNWQLAILSSVNNEHTEDYVISEGLVLGVNFEESDDLISVWNVQFGNIEEVLSTSLNYQEEIGTEAAPQFRLTLKMDGELQLYFCPDPSYLPERLIGSTLISLMPTGRHLAIRYQYSSARDRGLWIDDIRLDGAFLPDTVAPFLEEVKLPDEFSLQLWFSEKILAPADSSLRVIAESEFPFLLLTEDRSITLNFTQEIRNRQEQRLYISGICDPEGNCMPDTLVHFMRNDAEWGDVVITEVMADPEPVVRLEAVEYLEIKNRSAYPLDLENWSIQINGRSHTFQGMRLQSGEFGIIRDITLPNNGAELGLRSNRGILIHGVRYGIPWDGPEWKKDGGWSLESPDPECICLSYQLWEYSSHGDGGTPGRINSNDTRIEDQIPPVLLGGGISDTGTVTLYFSEPVRLAVEQTRLNPGDVRPGYAQSSIPVGDQWDLRFPEDVLNKSSFRLGIGQIKDCAGNLAHQNEISLGVALDPGFRSVVINEIMYDPFDWAPVFVELYNRSSRYIDLNELMLEVVKHEELLHYPRNISAKSRLLGPQEYLVLTRNVSHLMNAYVLERSGRWVEMDLFPSFPVSGGDIYLTSRSGILIDRVHYADEWHMELLDETMGISLERISSEKSGMDPGNWHSSASIEGYATPGRANSQAIEEQATEQMLELEPGVFSPDNDGFEDLQLITSVNTSPGCIVRIWITDLNGNPVRVLANNHIAGVSSTYTWDGASDDGSMVKEGLYVVFLKVYNPVDGRQWAGRKASGVIYP